MLFTQQPFSTVVAASNLSQLKTEWIWRKPQGTGFLNANQYPLKSHENVLVFCDRMPPYYPQMTTGSDPYITGKNRGSANYGAFAKVRTHNNGSRFPTTVLDYNRDPHRLHPTAKPVALCEYLIRTYTDSGAMILDCTMGSGTTGVAALITGRRFIGIERDPDYYRIACERIQAATTAQAA